MPNQRRLKVAIGAILLALLITSGAETRDPAPSSPSVVSFSPAGYIKNPVQVKAVFATPMVALGNFRAEDPFHIKCRKTGKGRWIDPGIWVYDFEQALPGGVICRFSLKNSLADLAGQPVQGRGPYEFNTGGPSVTSILPAAGHSFIDEEQVFILTLDAPAHIESILEHVYCSVEGLAEPVGIQQVPETIAAPILEELKLSSTEKNQRFALRCRQRLPNEARVQLVWDQGIQGSSGMENLERQTFAYRVRKAFFANVNCWRPQPYAPCEPGHNVQIYFSAPLSVAQAEAIRLVAADGKVKIPVIPRGRPDFISSVYLQAPFSAQRRWQLTLPKTLEDEGGRKLANALRFPMTIAFGPFAPVADFDSDFGIIEAYNNVKPQISVRIGQQGEKIQGHHLTFLDPASTSPDNDDISMLTWIKAMESSPLNAPLISKSTDASPFSMALPQNHETSRNLSIPLPGKGLHLLELKTMASDQRSSLYPRTMALVTDLAAHVKFNHDTIAVLVTHLHDATVAANARISVRDCAGASIAQGHTNAQGLFSASHIAQVSKATNDCPEPWRNGLFVIARLGDDATFTHTSWDEGVETWRYSIPVLHGDPDSSTAHTIFGRSLVRAGETLHMAHVIRKRSDSGLTWVPRPRLPDTMHIIHIGSGTEYQQPLEWNTSGFSESTFNIPEDAHMGRYRIDLLRKKDSDLFPITDDDSEYGSGRFQVEAFKVPVLTGALQTTRDFVVSPEPLALDMILRYLAGGPAADYEVEIHTQISQAFIRFPDYPDFRFARSPMKTGIIASGEGYKTYPGPGPFTIKLDAAGAARQTLEPMPPSEVPLDILTEMEFQDPNGERQTLSQTITRWSSAVVLGIKTDHWMLNQDKISFSVIAVDPSGQPMEGIRVKADWFKRSWNSVRKRLIGGFYNYESWQEVLATGAACEGLTDSLGLLHCEIKAPQSGNLILQASAQDKRERPAFTHTALWVTGADGPSWFEVDDSNRMEVIPEKDEYEPGEVAHLQVKMPFRKATAWVSIERAGIMESKVIALTNQNPVIDIPIESMHAPNIFVSVLALRGRIGDQHAISGGQAVARIDLGKPAFRFGITEIKVGRREHRLAVDVSTDRSSYHVRDRAKVDIRVAPETKETLPENAAVTLVVVDVGLLELAPNLSWDLLEHMLSPYGYGIHLATPQLHVVGQRSHERKAEPAGGGGGNGGITRELFDTLVTWRANVPLDDQGKASIEVPLNDSLSRFAVVAIARAGTDQFGVGKVEFTTTQPIMLFPGLPDLVRTGDRWLADFTVRNGSSQIQKVTITATMKPEGEALFDTLSLSPQNITLEPGHAQEIHWETRVPAKASSLKWHVRVADDSGNELDAIEDAVQVIDPNPARTIAANMLQINPKSSLKVQGSKDLGEKSAYRIKLQASLTGDLEGVRRKMEAYPFSCLEQQVSIAIALQDGQRWQHIMHTLPTYLDRNGLASYFPNAEAQGSEVLTAYLLKIADAALFPIPQAQRRKMETALAQFIEGSLWRESVISAPDLTLRKLSALAALSTSDLASAEMSETLLIEPRFWPTSALLDWIMVLHNIESFPERDSLSREAWEIVFNRMTLDDRTLRFATESADQLWWLMENGDNNAARVVKSLIERQDSQQNRTTRALFGLLNRRQQGAWSTTTANAWAISALQAFGQRYESQPPTDSNDFPATKDHWNPVAGTTRVTINHQSRALNWKHAPEGVGWKFAPQREPGVITFSHTGVGSPWAEVLVLGNPVLPEKPSHGYRITKHMGSAGKDVVADLKRGMVVQVRLNIHANADMAYVAIIDPIPAGARILGSGLGRDSRIQNRQLEDHTSNDTRNTWIRPMYEERRSDAFVAYYRFIPSGDFSVEYAMRLNQAGDFQLPPSRVEALYAPEIYGEWPNKTLRVTP